MIGILAGLDAELFARENFIEREYFAGILPFVFDPKYVLMLFITNNYINL